MSALNNNDDDIRRVNSELSSGPVAIEFGIIKVISADISDKRAIDKSVSRHRTDNTWAMQNGYL